MDNRSTEAQDGEPVLSGISDLVKRKGDRGNLGAAVKRAARAAHEATFSGSGFLFALFPNAKLLPCERSRQTGVNYNQRPHPNHHSKPEHEDPPRCW